jgi:EmrB/QacA subfamily drug resistance transporter
VGRLSLVNGLSLLNTEPPRPARIRESPRAWAYATATVCFGAFMGQLDASVVTLTYRPLERQFGASAAAVQWVSLAYLLALAALLPPIGRRSDRTGRKLSYLHGFVVFTAGSALCGLAPNLPVLILARALQAIGAALLQANSVALITRAAPSSKLRWALGIQAAAQAVGLALGPTAGGLIVAALGWRWVFAINIPVGLIAIPAAIAFLPRTRDRSARRTDSPGVALLAASTTAGLLVLSALGGLRIPTAGTVTLAIVAVAAAYGVVWRQRVAVTPVLARRVLSAPGVPPALVAATLSYLLLFGPLVLVPLGLGRVSSLEVGFIVTALPAGFAFAATIAGALLPRHWSDRHRSLTGAGIALVSLSVAALAPFSVPWLVGWLAALGLGLGVLAPANNASIMGAVPPDTTASAGGILNMTRSLGTAVGVSLVTLSLHAGGTEGPRIVLLIAALLTVVSLRS